MRCSECNGQISEDATFCTRCGAKVSRTPENGGEYADSRYPGQEGLHSQKHGDREQIPDSGYVPYYDNSVYELSLQNKAALRKKKIQVAAVAIILLTVSVFGISYVFFSYDEFETNDYIIFGDGAISSGVIGIESDPEDTDPYDDVSKIILTCNSFSSTYDWTITPLDNMFDYGINPDNPHSPKSYFVNGKAIKCKLNPGLHEVEVDIGYRTHTGIFALEGEVTREYEWSFGHMRDTSGTLPLEMNEFDLSITFRYSETIDSLTYKGERSTFYFDKMSYHLNEFVIHDSVFTYKLESLLRDEFDNKKIPHNHENEDGYNYASYLLTFVQEAITYASDKDLYGINEYWAFSTETIMRGYGDCEDTAFLCAALFKAAGFDTAMVLLPGHAMTGVYLPNHTLEYPNEFDTKDVYGRTITQYLITEEINDKMFYACETTHDEQFPIGYTSIMHVDKDGIEQRLTEWTQGGEHYKEDEYGFYLIDDS